MKTTPLKTTHIIQAKENLVNVIIETLENNQIILGEKSILVLAETVVATCQNRLVDISTITNISPKAQTLANDYQMDPRFVQVILEESDEIVGGIPTMLFTEKNNVLIANGGIDKSNSGPEHVYSLWPEFPFKTAENIRSALMKHYHIEHLGIIISDSRVQPMRRGVVGVAIGVAGFQPVIDERGRKDLYGHIMEYTTRAIADQLTDVAHVVMGECDEQTPFILIEDAPVNFTNDKVDPLAMIMPKTEDLFFRILQPKYKD